MTKATAGIIRAPENPLSGKSRRNLEIRRESALWKKEAKQMTWVRDLREPLHFLPSELHTLPAIPGADRVGSFSTLMKEV